MFVKIGLLIIGGLLLQGVFIVVEHKKRWVAANILKGLASLVFVLIGFVGWLQSPSSNFTNCVFAGLLLGMLGDILLNLRFVYPDKGQKIFLGGIAAFLIGHILYLCALIPSVKHLYVDIAIGAVLAAALLIYIFKTMKVKLAFKIFGIVYLGAVIIMTCMALDIAFFAASPRTITFAIGAILFTVSDIVLIFNTFSDVTKFSLRITNLSLYYIGQVLIACSLFLS